MAATITQLILFFTLCFTTTVKSVPNTNTRSVLCNSGEYTGGDPFAISLAYVLQELQTETPARKSYDYYNISPYPNAFAYGHATCNTNLTSPDCTTCLGAANATVTASCSRRIGGRALLFDCSIRYEQYPFKE
ncbi:antifungal protein ginkbilobin-like protein [Ipomoea triloba]|uniref:antifungal protein ginkbilobin-like protein n=1 Tax=Ipomoea triloba TaxID=35885 RepID=UPI00125E5940|nr:antifungal protein ginkbilobin-like protein [Ipomoea triloba]